MNFRAALMFLLLLTHATAQETSDLRSLPRRFATDEWQIWTSPFRKDSYNSQSVKKYVIPFALISGALIAGDRKIADQLPNSNDQVKWSGRVSQFGSAYSMAGLAGGTYLLGLFTKNERIRETGMMSMEALAHTQIVVFGLKQLTNRQRPVDSDGRGGFWEGGNSFPSGHAASAFAIATVFSYEYKDNIVVPIVAYSAAGLISASRLGARRHWVSDIFVGGSLGFLLGRYVYQKHQNSGRSGAFPHGTQLIPNVGASSEGIALAWRW